MDFELPRAALPPRRPRTRSVAGGLVLLALAVIAPFAWHALDRPRAPRVVVLGFDGLEIGMVGPVHLAHYCWQSCARHERQMARPRQCRLAILTHPYPKRPEGHP